MTSVIGGGGGGIDSSRYREQGNRPVEQDTTANKPKMSPIQRADAQRVVSGILRDGTIDANEREILHDLGRDFSKADLSVLEDSDGEALNPEVTELFRMGAQTSREVRDLERTVDQIPGINPQHRQQKVKINTGSIENTGRSQASTSQRTMSADRLNCVSDALGIISANTGQTWSVPAGPQHVNTDNLRTWTGSEWDAMNLGSYKNPEDVRTALAGQEGKALIVDGAHTYVYMGMSPEGQALVRDSSAADGTLPRPMSFDGTSVTVYVQGHGDGNMTGEVNAADLDKAVRPFGQVQRLDGDTDETFNMRKLMTFISDPAQSENFNQFKTMVAEAAQNNFTTGDIDSLSQFLKDNGIELDETEIRAMCNVLTRPVNSSEGETNLLNLFDDLNNPSPDGSLTIDQRNFSVGIQYSHIPLDNWFSNASSATSKAQDMYDVANAMMNGEDGC